MRSLISVIVMLCCAAALADFEAGVQAAARGDHAAALREWRPLAEAGDVDAQNNLAQMYRKGEGVPVDLAEAVKWMRMAAAQGHALAQYNLGVSYAEGRGVAEDAGAALAWFRRAAEQGNAHAQFNLGVMYDNGHGVAEDDAEAVKWFRLAAEQGFASARYSIGNMYRQGHGVAKDDAEAVKWFRLAAEQGFAEGQNNLGFMYAHGLGVAADDVLAHVWFARAAAQGDESARRNLDFIRARMSATQVARAETLATQRSGADRPAETALAADARRYVTQTRVSYRSGPGTQHRRLGVFGVGVELQAEALAGDWLRVRLDDARIAYVHRDYVRAATTRGTAALEARPRPAEPRPSTDALDHIATAALTVRAGPGVAHDPIAWLSAGTAVQVLDASTAWVRVRLEDARVGYVAGSYLTPRP